MLLFSPHPEAVPSGGRVAILPVGFAEFRGDFVRSGDGTALKVLNSAASTTVVAVPENIDLGIGDEVGGL